METGTRILYYKINILFSGKCGYNGAIFGVDPYMKSTLAAARL